MSLQGLGAGLTVCLVLAGAAAAQDYDGSLSAAERRAVAASGLPRNQVVSVRRDLVVAIRSRGTTKGGVLFEGVTLAGEVVSADAARSFGYRSMRSTVNVDCGRRRDLVVRMTIYPEAAGKGEAIVRQVPGGWVQPSPSAFMSDVIESICSDTPIQAVAAPERPPKRVAAPPLRVVESAPEPVAEVEPAPSPLDRANSEMIATAPSVRRPRLAIPIEAVTGPVQRAQAPAPRPVPKPEPAVVSTEDAPPKPGPGKVQVAAVATAKQARSVLDKLGALPAPLSKTVQEATVDGRTVYRAMVVGFETRANAKIFCEVVVESGGACFVR